jgi:hypothetical protein
MAKTRELPGSSQDDTGLGGPHQTILKDIINQRNAVNNAYNTAADHVRRKPTGEIPL